MTLAVVPVLYGPLQVLLALLPGLLMMLGGALLALFKPSTFKQSLRLFWRLKWPLLAGAAMVCGCVWAVKSLLPKPAATQAETALLDWPQFRGGPQRLGAIPGSPPPLTGGVTWRFSSEMKTFYSSPAVIGNRVYCTGSNKGAFSDKGAVFCLDADTGALVWKAAPDGFRSTFSSPSISGKYLVVGEGLHEIKDARIFCFDIEQQGKVLWSHRTSSHVESSACIADGRVCMGAGDDGYYCFALEPGPQGQPQMLWHAPHERYPDAECSPAYHDGKFYVGLGLRGNALVCLDAKSGSELWRVATPYPVFAPPTITNGKIVFGMGNGNFIENAEQAALKELGKLKAAGATDAKLADAAEKLKAGGEVWCISLTTPKPDVLWRYKTAEIVLGAVAAADDGKLYFGARDGFVYALSPDGAELGRWNARGPILASVSVSGNYLYSVTESGRIQALNRMTLEPAWNADLGGGAPILSSPAIARGHVYLGSMTEGLRCIGVPGEPEFAKKKVWAGMLGGPGMPGYLGEADLPERGSLLWRWSADASAESALKSNAPPAILGDLICLPIAKGALSGLVALANDPLSTEPPKQRWHFPAATGVWVSPAIVPADSNSKSGLVFVVNGKQGDADRHLNCLNAADGSVLWRAPMDTNTWGFFSVLGDKLICQSGTSDVACYSMNGTLLWKNPYGALSGPADHHQDIAVITLSSASKMTAIDLPTGRELWSVYVKSVTGPVIDGSVIYIGVSTGVNAYRLLDGRPLWSAQAANPLHELSLSKGRLTTTTLDGEIKIIDTKSGIILAAIPGAHPAIRPILSDNAVIYGSSSDALMRAVLTEHGAEAPQRWMAAGRLGAFTSPMVSADKCLFFSTEKYGLIKAGKAP